MSGIMHQSISTPPILVAHHSHTQRELLHAESDADTTLLHAPNLYPTGCPPTPVGSLRAHGTLLRLRTSHQHITIARLAATWTIDLAVSCACAATSRFRRTGPPTLKRKRREAIYPDADACTYLRRVWRMREASLPPLLAPHLNPQRSLHCFARLC